MQARPAARRYIITKMNKVWGILDRKTGAFVDASKSNVRYHLDVQALALNYIADLHKDRCLLRWLLLISVVAHLCTLAAKYLF